MRSRLWHAAGITILLFLGHMGLTSCSSSGENADATENLSTEEGGDGNAAQATDENAAPSGDEQANGEQAADSNETADGGAGAAGGEPVADNAAGGQQGDLQEIIEEMNGGEAPAAGNGAGAAAPNGGANAAALDGAANAAATGAPPANVAAAPVANAGGGGAASGAPPAASGPVPAGLPEMGSKMPYIVQKGDTLAKIAQKVYSDASKWSEIQTFTNLSNPRLIYPGDVVYYQLTEQTVAFAGAYESVQRSEVQVQQGDTLSTIASRVLGSASNWKLVWRQNDGIDNPDKLTAGTTLYYIAPGALSAAINEFKTHIAETQKEVVRVIAQSHEKTHGLNLLENNEQTDSVNTDATDNAVDNEIEADFASFNAFGNFLALSV